jgi:hypothetical protein
VELGPRKLSSSSDPDRVDRRSDKWRMSENEGEIRGAPTARDGEVSRPAWAQQQMLWPPADMTAQSAKLSAESSTLA